MGVKDEKRGGFLQALAGQSSPGSVTDPASKSKREAKEKDIQCYPLFIHTLTCTRTHKYTISHTDEHRQICIDCVDTCIHKRLTWLDDKYI